VPAHIVAIGDIGVIDGMIHIGDEAMFEAFVAEMRRRGIDGVTGISSAPAESARRYGIAAIAGIGFGRDRAANNARMRAVIGAARGTVELDADDPAGAVIAAIADSDGVAVTGGGNMASIWPHHVFERATIGAVAAALGKPLVVSGQTMGPELDRDDAALVRDLLASAAVVGVREPSSLQLCRALGLTNLTSTVDDASYLVSDPAEPGDYCLVSLASHVGDADRDAVVAAVASMLDEIPLEVVFLAHFGALDPALSRGDSVMHDRVIEAMSQPARVVAPTDSPAGARLARNAGMVVSSRYHPVVFAVPAGVPTVGIPVDDYTGVKLRGALGNFGQDGVLEVQRLLAGEGTAETSRVLSKRTAIADEAARLSEDRQAASADWWDRVAATFGG